MFPETKSRETSDSRVSVEVPYEPCLNEGRVLQ